MNFIETESGDLINLNKVVLICTINNKPHVYVHLFLNEFRSYEISELTFCKIKNRFIV